MSVMGNSSLLFSFSHLQLVIFRKKLGMSENSRLFVKISSKKQNISDITGRILQLSQSNCKRQFLHFFKLNVDHSVQAGKFKRNLASYCFAAVAIMILFGLVALPCSAFFCFASLFCSTSHELRLTVKIKVSNLEHHQNWKVYQNSIFAMID